MFLFIALLISLDWPAAEGARLLCVVGCDPVITALVMALVSPSYAFSLVCGRISSGSDEGSSRKHGLPVAGEVSLLAHSL